MVDQENRLVEDNVEFQATPGPTLRMHESDRAALETAKLNAKLALSEAQNAISRNELAELKYRYVVLEIYLKYGLNERDAINENGEIIKNGAQLAKRQ